MFLFFLEIILLKIGNVDILTQATLALTHIHAVLTLCCVVFFPLMGCFDPALDGD